MGRANNLFEELCSVIEKDQPAVTATVVRGPAGVFGREFLMDNYGRLSGRLENGVSEQVANLTSEILVRGRSPRVQLSDELEVFFDVILPPPTLIVVGGVHIAMALISLAKTLGYGTILIDPRKAWGNTGHFLNVDQLVQAWPEEAFAQHL